MRLIVLRSKVMLAKRRAKRIIYRLLPDRVRTSLKMLSILDGRYGHWLSITSGEAANKDGEPIPWYTYPAIEYLDQLDFSDKAVFEWGSGNSSLYWARVARSVASVEDDPKWFGKTDKKKPGNLTIHLIQDKQEYVNAIVLANRRYDVIVIDGSHRFECALVAPTHLGNGGLIILDNSDWLPEAARVLREAGLLQVDMSGFGPAAELTWTTSLFYHREFSISSKGAQQPRPSLGSVPPPSKPKYGLR